MPHGGPSDRERTEIAVEAWKRRLPKSGGDLVGRVVESDLIQMGRQLTSRFR